MTGCTGTLSGVPGPISPVRQPCAIRHLSRLAAGNDGSSRYRSLPMTILNPPQTIKTLGTITFSTCGETRQPLFRINPEIPIESALEHASNLLACASEISLDAALGDAGKQS